MSRLRFGQLSRRLYVAFLIAAAIPTAVAGIIGVYFSLQALRAETTGKLEHEVDFRAQGATRFFEQVSSELLFLARDYAAAEAGTAADGSAVLEARIRADFLALARHYPHVYQIRLLDRSGLERIRVDRVDQGTRSTAPELLQNKSDRYYFQEAIRLSPGQLYVSPLDLNVEFGRTETPERPVIRFATTFDSPAGGGRQLLIINPADAAPKGIESGDFVQVYNDTVYIQTGQSQGVKDEDQYFDTLMKDGHIQTTEGQFVAVAIVSEEMRPGVAMANFNYPQAPANSIVHAVPDPVTNNYRYKLGRGVLTKVGESPYKHSFTSMTLKPRDIV